MNKFINKESHLESVLKETNENIMSEFDLQFSINELASILNRSESIERKIIYTAEAVPVFIMDDNEGKTNYVVEQDVLNKLMSSQHIDVGTAIQHIKEALLEEIGDAHIINSSDLSVVFNKEDIDLLQSVVKDDPTKIECKCEEVSIYNNYLNEIKSTGASLLFKEK